MKINHAKTSAEKRRKRVRAKVRGTSERPRLNVFRSNKNIYLQVINDELGKTVLSAGSATQKTKETKTETAKLVAQQLAEKMKAAKVTKLVFDRGSYKYHGRVKVIAETMREQGIEV
jgi:large subunit ribosomal protein L18